MKNQSVSRRRFLRWWALLVLCTLFVGTFRSTEAVEQASLTFYAFSNSKCPPCIERMAVLNSTYPRARVIMYELEENAKYFQRMLQYLNESFSREIVPPVPLVGVFEDDALRVITGGGMSKERWKQVVERQHEGVLVYFEDTSGGVYFEGTIRNSSRIEGFTSIFRKSIPVEGDGLGILSLLVPVAAAAMVDAVNPCAFNTFVVLLTFSLFSVGKKGVLKVGFSFSSAVFLVYFLLGLGLIRFLVFLPQIRYLIAGFATALGILKLIEASGRKIRYMPTAFADRLSSRLESSMNPRSGFIAGALTAALILPCSSAPYFLALDLLSSRATLLEGLALLVIYNLIMIAPFVALTLGVHALSLSTMDVKLWAKEKQRWINLFMGAVLIMLSLLVLLL